MTAVIPEIAESDMAPLTEAELASRLSVVVFEKSTVSFSRKPIFVHRPEGAAPEDTYMGVWSFGEWIPNNIPNEALPYISDDRFLKTAITACTTHGGERLKALVRKTDLPLAAVLQYPAGNPMGFGMKGPSFAVYVAADPGRPGVIEQLRVAHDFGRALEEAAFNT